MEDDDVIDAFPFQAFSLSLRLSLSHTHTLSLSVSLSLCLSLSHTHTHSLSLTHTRSLSHTHTEIASCIDSMMMLEGGWVLGFGVWGFRGGLVFKAHRWLYHSTLGSRVIKKKEKFGRALSMQWSMSPKSSVASGSFPIASRILG